MKKKDMMDMRKPKTVKVTVYSCRNLKPKKGNGDPLAWVVFGFGKDKCCTSQIRDRNAKWNEESTFTISDTKIPLKINIKDKDDPLGQILIPVNDIPSDEHFLKWVPLGPHKKNSNPDGELCIDCWIDDYYDGSATMGLPTIPEKQTKPMKYLNKISNRLTGKSPESARKNRQSSGDSPETVPRRFSVATGNSSMKGSVSIEDVSQRNKSSLFNNRFTKDKDKETLSPFYNGAEREDEPMRRASSTSLLTKPVVEESGRRNSYSVCESSKGLPTIKEQNFPPKIQNIVPFSGPTTGGTLIQITGRYLGTGRDDISRLMVAGCNCLDTLEYYSQNKIMCTTSASVGTGPISISTKTGGMSASKIMFAFVERQPEDEVEETLEGAIAGRALRLDSGRSSGASDADRDKDEIIDKLRNNIDQLKYDNRELREYIDKLVVYLMDKYPDALESSKMYR